MMNLLLIGIPVIWMSFFCYLFWYITSAKHYIFITKKYANVLWKIHKGNQMCKGIKWRAIMHKDGKIMGFKCDCGYTYSQTKPVLSSLPKTIHQNTNLNSEIYPNIKY